MHIALPIELKLFSPDGKVFEAKAIATNISEGGLLAEYLNLEAANQIQNLPNVGGFEAEIRIFQSAHYPEEHRLKGKVNRRELRKKQLGIAVEFEAQNSEKGVDIRHHRS